MTGDFRLKMTSFVSINIFYDDAPYYPGNVERKQSTVTSSLVPKQRGT